MTADIFSSYIEDVLKHSSVEVGMPRKNPFKKIIKRHEACDFVILSLEADD
jgi:hypothetical protein